MRDHLDPSFEERTIHLAIYTQSLDGDRELFRHFVRRPDGMSAWVCACMSVWVHACMRVWEYACMSVWVYERVYECMCVSLLYDVWPLISIYIHCASITHTPIHTTSIYVHTCIHTYIHTHIHTYIHTCTHTYIHTYTYFRSDIGGIRFCWDDVIDRL